MEQIPRFLNGALFWVAFVMTPQFILYWICGVCSAWVYQPRWMRPKGAPPGTLRPWVKVLKLLLPPLIPFLWLLLIHLQIHAQVVKRLFHSHLF